MVKRIKGTWRIYTIKLNGSMRYIGCTASSLAERWQQHGYAARVGHTSPIAKLIREQGVDAFEVCVIYEVEDRGLAFALEHELVSKHSPPCNRTLGGLGAPGLKHSPEVRAMLSSRRIGVPVPEKVRQKMSATHKGKVIPEETIQKIREANGSPEMREYFRKTSTGRKHSEETRAKMRATMGTPEYRQRLSERVRGRKHSPEAIEKMKTASAKRQKGSDGRYV